MPSDLYPRAVGDPAPTPDLTRWATLARRVVWVAAITAAGITGLAMVLSYAGLRSAYLGAGFGERVSSAAPLIVDPLFLVAYIALLVLPRKGYPGFVLIFGLVISAAAQGYHSSHGGTTAAITDGRVTFLFGASFMAFAGMAGHLFWKIAEQYLPAGFITAMRGADPVPTAQLPPGNRPHAVPSQRAVGAEDTDNVFRHLPPPPPPVALVKPQVSPAARSARKTTTAKVPASQQSGPCHPDCRHHANRGDVSKSARYRCVATLNGNKTGAEACQPCLRELGKGERA